MKQSKLLDVVLLIFKILIPLILILSLTFFSYRLIESRLSDIQNVDVYGYRSGTGLYYFASSLVLLMINGGALVLSSAGLLTSRLYKASPRRQTSLTYFKWMIAAPFISQGLYLLVGILVSHIG